MDISIWAQKIVVSSTLTTHSAECSCSDMNNLYIKETFTPVFFAQLKEIWKLIVCTVILHLEDNYITFIYSSAVEKMRLILFLLKILLWYDHKSKKGPTVLMRTYKKIPKDQLFSKLIWLIYDHPLGINTFQSFLVNCGLFSGLFFYYFIFKLQLFDWVNKKCS